MKNMKLSTVLVSGFAAALAFSPAHADARCVGSLPDAGKAYAKQLNTLPDAVFGALMSFHDKHYTVSEGDWDGRGWTGSVSDLKNDKREEYGKHFMAAMLIESGVQFEPREFTYFNWDGNVSFVALTPRAFHANEDYSAVARGLSPTKQYTGYSANVDASGWHWYPTAARASWHPYSTHLAEDGDGTLWGLFQWHSFSPWYEKGPIVNDFFSGNTFDATTTTFCGVYDPSSGQATPAGLAGTLVHEGWHSRMKPPMTDHQARVLPEDGGFCTYANSPDGTYNCDTWYTHSKSEFGKGDAFFSSNTGALNTGDPNKYLSPLSTNQFEDEYLCDLADNGKDSLPLSVVLGAGTAAEAKAERFNNVAVPKYNCGLPTPMYGVAPGTRTTECGGETRCNTNSDCNASEGEVCSVSSGCCYELVIK